VDTMATKYLNLRFKFGGILVSEVGPIYVGGRTEYVENVDEDHLSIPELADYAKSFGINWTDIEEEGEPTVQQGTEPSIQEESITGKKRGRGQYERASNSKTSTRRGAVSGYKKRPKVVGQGVFVADTGYTCINQGLSSSRRVNSGVVSSAHVTGDISFKPTKGLKWKGK
ncbi:hypothetical protein KY284_012357, partial [Solanum tuberosum]